MRQKALIDMTGQVFGRLTVLKRLHANLKREWYWYCLCKCGNVTEVKRSNLISGGVASCGCLARELTIARDKARKQPIIQCSVEGCEKDAREFSRTLCRMHGKRMRIYGNPNFVMSEDERIKKQRDSTLKKYAVVKPNTYRKYFGRHEHRVIGEQLAGRVLRSDEHVHHIDGNKQNNDPSNLMVLSAADHARLHMMEKING